SSHFVIHPAYVPNQFEYDIALVSLSVPFSPDPLLSPAELPLGTAQVNDAVLYANYSSLYPPGTTGVYRGTVSAGSMYSTGGCGADVFCSVSPTQSACKGDSGSGIIEYRNGMAVVTGVLSYAQVYNTDCAAIGADFKAT